MMLIKSAAYLQIRCMCALSKCCSLSAMLVSIGEVQWSLSWSCHHAFFIRKVSIHFKPRENSVEKTGYSAECVATHGPHPCIQTGSYYFSHLHGHSTVQTEIMDWWRIITQAFYKTHHLKVARISGCRLFRIFYPYFWVFVAHYLNSLPRNSLSDRNQLLSI